MEMMFKYDLPSRSNLLTIRRTAAWFIVFALAGALVSWSVAGSPSRHFSLSAEESDGLRGLERARPGFKTAAFWNTNFAWLIGYETGDLWRTQDGGKTWQNIAGSIVGGKFHAASFISEHKGWAVGAGGAVWRSDDGGQTWIKVSTLGISIPNAWSFLSSDQIKFVDHSNGWLVETFGIWRTEDGGNNWSRVLAVGDPGVTGQPAGAAFGSSRAAVVSSDDGKVYRTQDGGKTWQIQTIIPRGSLRHVSYSSESTVWMTGYGPPHYTSVVLRSDDEGRTWQPSPTKNGDISIYSTHFVGKEQGWIVGALSRQGRSDQRPPEGSVMRTLDGGQNWKQVQVPLERSFEEVHFSDPSHGWLVSSEHVYRTEDAGRSWKTVLKLAR